MALTFSVWPGVRLWICVEARPFGYCLTRRVIYGLSGVLMGVYGRKVGNQEPEAVWRVRSDAISYQLMCLRLPAPARDTYTQGSVR